MDIHYVENKNGKLFSFFRHDYKENTDDEGNYIMIDGGFEYKHYSGELKTGTIEELISEIREQFTWGQNYDENNNRLPKTKYILLKNLTTSHIVGILLYMTEKTLTDVLVKKIYSLIFLNELKYRIKNEIFVS